MNEKRLRDHLSFKETVRHFKSSVADNLMLFKEMLVDHGKVILPVLLVLFSAVTVFIALSARSKVEAAIKDASHIVEETVKVVHKVEETEFEVNKYPQVNELVMDYYEALEIGDVEALSVIQSSVTNAEIIRLGKMSEYIDRYDDIVVYTKPGPYDDTYIVYVFSEVFLIGREEGTPGLQAFYVCQDENGGYYINTSELTKAEAEYIKAVSEQSDVVDLKNSVNVNYNTIMEENEELSQYWAHLSVEIDLAVGEQIALDAYLQAQLENELNPNQVDTNVPEPEPEPEVTTNETIKVRTLSSVNVRKTPSASADKIGTANAGQTFILLENMINGWSKIKYEKTEGYIKSDLLEQLESVSDLSVVGKATATTGLNVRMEPSQASTKIGVLQKGQSVDLVYVSDGWCKVIFNGEIGYVKADYVTMD